MSIINPTDIWKIIAKYDLHSPEPIPIDCICIYCQMILKDARLAPCGCRFCKMCSHTYVEDEEKFCPGSKSTCRCEMLTKNTHFLTDFNTNRRIWDLLVTCPNDFCIYECKLKQLGDHLNECRRNNLVLSSKKRRSLSSIYEKQGSCDSNLKVLVVSLQKEISSLKSREQLNQTELSKMKNKVKLQEKEFDKLREEFSDSQGFIKSLQSQIQCLKEENDNWKEMADKDNFSQLSHLNCCHKQKVFVWKVSHFSKIQGDAQCGIDVSIFSNSFYSADNGYKLCLGMNPDGANQYKGKYLFVFFCIMSGPDDDNLPWPMKHEISLSIVDQSTLRNYKTFKFQYETTSKFLQHSFFKPAYDKNDGIGDNEFISFKELKSSGHLLKNDSVLIRCLVDIL